MNTIRRENNDQREHLRRMLNQRTNDLPGDNPPLQHPGDYEPYEGAQISSVSTFDISDPSSAEHTKQFVALNSGFQPLNASFRIKTAFQTFCAWVDTATVTNRWQQIPEFIALGDLAIKGLRLAIATATTIHGTPRQPTLSGRVDTFQPTIKKIVTQTPAKQNPFSKYRIHIQQILNNNSLTEHSIKVGATTVMMQAASQPSHPGSQAQIRANSTRGHNPLFKTSRCSGSNFWNSPPHKTSVAHLGEHYGAKQVAHTNSQLPLHMPSTVNSMNMEEIHSLAEYALHHGGETQAKRFFEMEFFGCHGEGRGGRSRIRRISLKISHTQNRSALFNHLTHSFFPHYRNKT